jgi:hypothetical protein
LASGGVAGLVQAGEEIGMALDLIARKNEAIVGGIPRNPLFLKVFQLDGAKLLHRFLELAPTVRSFQSSPLPAGATTIY